MAAVVANTVGDVVPAPSVDKGSRNKRKFRSDPPLGDPNKFVSLSDNDLPICNLPSENPEATQTNENSSGCQMCCSSLSHDHPGPLKLGLGLVSSEASSCQSKEENEDDLDNADWSDLTESQLEELLLKNLDTVFKSALKKIVACGYSEEFASKAVLRSGVYYGSKDIVSNIFENALAILRDGIECDSLKEHFFEDLVQMEKYVLAELVCVLREVKPSFSTGDAMWCLLVSDMNVTHACALDCSFPPSSSSGNVGLGGSNSSPDVDPSESTLMKTETASSGFSFSAPGKSNQSSDSAETYERERMPVSRVPNFVKPKKMSHSPISSNDGEIKSFCGRKVSGITKREYVLRQKSLHLEKAYRTHCSRGSSRAGKLNGFSSLMLDKKLRSLSESASVNFKSTTDKLTKTTVVGEPQDKGTLELPSKDKLETKDSVSDLVEAESSGLSAADTDLSLSLSVQKDLCQLARLDKKDEMMLKLFPRVRDLQAQLQEWTEWANLKVMQAARRLGKDKAELKALRQERDEMEKLRKEKQALEENTVKKLSEMENALRKTGGQVERANGEFRRLEAENAGLRQEMEVAKQRAAEAALGCREVVEREKMNLSKVQAWEKQKGLFKEELMAEKRKLAALDREVELAKDRQDQQEARLKQEAKAKEELLNQANLVHREREQLEALTREDEERMKSQAEMDLQKYKGDIEKLQKEISLLRNSSSKVAALKRGIDRPDTKEAHLNGLSRKVAPELEEFSGLKRERECVMCLSEEMSVVFLPCAHQVVCAKCNELHEKQGMKDCPSCRSLIQRRILVRYAHS